jgi:hypothetical protein
VVPADFITAASSEIDAKLGFIYATPFILSGGGAMPLHQAKLIEDICIKLASGRIILAATSTMEQSTIHAYGASLVRDAQVSLMAIANGEVNLAVTMVDSEGNPRPPGSNPEDDDPLAYVPSASNRDSDSAVEAFERNFMQDPSTTYRSTVYDDPYRPGV